MGVVGNEFRMFGCLVRWLGGRYEKGKPDSFSYHQNFRPLLVMCIGLLVLEGAIVDVLLAVFAGGTPWPWIWLVLHGYALVWMISLLASFIVLPHVVEQDQLRIRDGVYAEVVIPRVAVERAQVMSPSGGSSLGRTGLKIDKDARTAVLAYGEPNVRIVLTSGREIRVNGRTTVPEFDELRITVDNTPAKFVAELR